VTHRYFPLLFAFACVLLPGCGNRGVQNEAAVRQGVIDYLAQRSDINLSTMQVDVTSVSFRQNEADATVSFRPKGGGAEAGAGMQMRYTLERKGSKWVVKGRGRSGTGSSPHGAGAMPPGAGPGRPAEGGAKEGSGLPPGHPPLGSSPGTK
jgi:hypothetical protein